MNKKRRLQCKNCNRLKFFPKYGAGTRNRTRDTRIFSPLLYRLSYPGTSYGEGYLPDFFSSVNRFSSLFFAFPYYLTSLWIESPPRSRSKSRSSSMSMFPDFLPELPSTKTSEKSRSSRESTDSSGFPFLAG